MFHKFAQIVFLQGDDYAEFNRILSEGSLLDALYYLRQWDYGDYDDIRNSNSAGPYDDSWQYGQFLMTWNSGHGYAGLQLMI